VEAVGVEFLEVINPVNVEISKEIFKKALQFDGVAVVISKYPCMLTKKGVSSTLLMTVDPEKCDKCLNCLKELTCPAIYTAEDGSVNIDSMSCRGCSVCMQICPKKAIGAKRLI
ncbi:MAG TPA: 4Fe-4S binding protein, partial [Methanobacterium sp.]|nr:4Fe-4S binding protein [Methanobacterium sp.]